MPATRIVALLITALATPAPAGTAGPFTFSDELGGFAIRSVSGSGTAEDPVVLVEDLLSAGPVTMVIRIAELGEGLAWSQAPHLGQIHIEVRARNASGHVWLAFEFELQEELGRPSTFGDGLSFDQGGLDTQMPGSVPFRRHYRQFEPHDRLLFVEGAVDPGADALFSFLINDVTPTAEFYLVQDPRIPAS